MKFIRLISLLLIPLMFLACNRSKNNPGYDYMGKHDMYYTKFYKAFTPNPVFRDSITNQLPVEGAVARGKMPFPYPGASIAERAANQAKAGLEVNNPLEVNTEVLTNGKAHYDIFCINCHGKNGKGDGNLYTSGLFPAKPTSLVEPYVQSKPDGEIFYVITHGSISGLMGPHGAQIQPEDRWSIVSYIRDLAN
ncbi:MAG: c-type cytochrome [Bacteroidetes bacterium]|nr:c-type cytochrome [Bacteroidota bacterium]